MVKQTKENIRKNSKRQARRRRLKFKRLFSAIVIAVIVLGLGGWLSYLLFSWGSGVYGHYAEFYYDYQQRKSLREQSFDHRFDGYTNILIIGLDEGMEDSGPQADSIQLLSFDDVTGDVRFISIPRYTLTDIPGREKPEALNNAYYYGGINLVEQSVSKLLGVTIHHYLVLDTKVLADMVDILGGIDIYVETDMDYEDPEGNLYINIRKGYQHMDGDTAQKYLRYRSDEIGSVGRIPRHQLVIKALYDRLMSPDTIAKIPDLVLLGKTRITTTAELFDTAHLTNELYHLKNAAPKTVTLPGSMAPDGSGAWICDKEKTAEKMAELFPVHEQEE